MSGLDAVLDDFLLELVDEILLDTSLHLALTQSEDEELGIFLLTSQRPQNEGACHK